MDLNVSQHVCKGMCHPSCPNNCPFTKYIWLRDYVRPDPKLKLIIDVDTLTKDDISFLKVCAPNIYRETKNSIHYEIPIQIRNRHISKTGSAENPPPIRLPKISDRDSHKLSRTRRASIYSKKS